MLQAKRDNLGGLQDEQARLKAEYDRMEVSLPPTKRSSTLEIGVPGSDVLQELQVPFGFQGMSCAWH